MTAASTTTTHVFTRGACAHPHSAKRVVIGLKPAREYVRLTFCWVFIGLGQSRRRRVHRSKHGGEATKQHESSCLQSFLATSNWLE